LVKNSTMKWICFLFLLSLSIIIFCNSAVILTESFSSSVINLSGTILTMDLCLWNLESYQGKAYLEYRDGKVEFSCDMKRPVILDPMKWVWAYPEVYYGYKPWAKRGISQDTLPLPKILRSISEFWLEVEYNISSPKWLSINMALDSWFTKQKYPTSVGNNDVEVMIWLYYHALRPAGRKIAEFTLPVVVSNSEIQKKWEVWYQQMDWDYLAFRMKEPIKEGKVRLPVWRIFQEASKILSKISGNTKNLNELYLEDLELGSEFGSPYIPKAMLKWYISRFKILTDSPR